MALRRRIVGEESTMSLKPPGILTFTLSLVLVVCVVLVRYFEANIPLLAGREFWALLAAYILLLVGCMIRI
jgi:hypothetical protein